MVQNKQFNWRGNSDLITWLKQEAARLRLTNSECLDAAVKHWQNYISEHGDQEWLPGRVDQ